MRSPIEAARWVRDAFRPPVLPERPAEILNKQARRAFDREVTAVQKQRDVLSGRRRLIFGGSAAAAVASTVLAVGGPRAVELIFRQENVSIPEEFSGELEETRSVLALFDKEIGKDPRKLEKHLPQVVKLATAYFSKQMGEIFPERRNDYDKERFKDRFNFVSESELILRRKEWVCDTSGREILATADPLSGRIFMSPAGAGKAARLNTPTKLAFQIAIHELLHASAKFKEGVEGTPTEKGERIDFKKGLMWHRINLERREDQKCYQNKWSDLEETVVEHTALEFSNKVAPIVSDSSYSGWASNYNASIISQKFGGRFEELLNFQQTTNLDAFLATIGEKFMQGEAPYEQKIQNGIFVFDRQVVNTR